MTDNKQAMREAFEDWMVNVAKIVVGSTDPYPARLEQDYWRVWQAATLQLQPATLANIDSLAKVYSSSYASPHHITFTVEGLRNLIAALAQPVQPDTKVCVAQSEKSELQTDLSLTDATQASTPPANECEQGSNMAEITKASTAFRPSTCGHEWSAGFISGAFYSPDLVEQSANEQS